MEIDAMEQDARRLPLFDVERGSLTLGANPRPATQLEQAHYAAQLAARAGLPDFDHQAVQSDGVTFGELLQHARWQDVERLDWQRLAAVTERVQVPAQYADGAYSIPFPGRRQPLPTMDELDEAGNVVRSISLPTDRKGAVAIKRDAVKRAVGPIAKPAKPARAARKPVEHRPAASGTTGHATPAPLRRASPAATAAAIPHDGEMADRAPTPDGEMAGALLEMVGELQRRLAALEATVGAGAVLDPVAPPMAGSEPRMAGSGPARAARLRIVRRYLAMRRERAAMRESYAALQGEAAAMRAELDGARAKLAGGTGAVANAERMARDATARADRLAGECEALLQRATLAERQLATWPPHFVRMASQLAVRKVTVTHGHVNERQAA